MRDNFDWLMGFKGMVGVASCAVGLCVVYFGYGIGTEGSKKNALAEAAPVRDKHRPVWAMNVALGNMVFFARDLGYAVKSTAHHAPDQAKIAGRIENQLNGVRGRYRDELAQNGALAGVIVLQINVNSAGEVRQVRELSARLPNEAFKKAVASEIARWSFAEIVDHEVELTCPLLFVHQGMDITTLVQWEKALRAAEAGPAHPAAASIRSTSRPGTVAAPAAAATRPTSGADPRLYQLRFATVLRADPNFSSPAVANLGGGAKVGVLRRHGEWFEIRSLASGATGFIRKEFLAPAEMARH